MSNQHWISKKTENGEVKHIPIRPYGESREKALRTVENIRKMNERSRLIKTNQRMNLYAPYRSVLDDDGKAYLVPKGMTRDSNAPIGKFIEKLNGLSQEDLDKLLRNLKGRKVEVMAVSGNKYNVVIGSMDNESVDEFGKFVKQIQHNVEVKEEQKPKEANPTESSPPKPSETNETKKEEEETADELIERIRREDERREKEKEKYNQELKSQAETWKEKHKDSNIVTENQLEEYRKKGRHMNEEDRKQWDKFLEDLKKRPKPAEPKERHYSSPSEKGKENADALVREIDRVRKEARDKDGKKIHLSVKMHGNDTEFYHKNGHIEEPVMGLKYGYKNSQRGSGKRYFQLAWVNEKFLKDGMKDKVVLDQDHSHANGPVQAWISSDTWSELSKNIKNLVDFNKIEGDD